MPASPLDSTLFAGLFGDAELSAAFTEAAELRAMLRVEAALARAQAAEGLIPIDAAEAIAAEAEASRIDGAMLADRIGRDGVPVPALVAALRGALPAEAGRWVHWGATSQDIVDTGLVLRLRDILNVQERRLRGLIGALGALAEAQAELPMAARTYGQAAVPTAFGAVVAGWGAPLLRHLDRLEPVRHRFLRVSLSGAAGTLSAMGTRGPAVRARMAEALQLGDPGASWHGERDGVAELAGWACAVTVALGRMGEDLILLSQSGIDEVRLAGGGSSTMPQKVNPVAPSVLVALARAAVALGSGVQGAALHRQQRDGAAWFVEWLLLPQLLLGCGRALTLARDVALTLEPDAQRMAANLEGDLGLIHAEALSFALSSRIPRPQAQAEVAALCAAARQGGRPLPALAADRFPDLPPLTADLGTAPAEARRFAAAARGAAL